MSVASGCAFTMGYNFKVENARVVCDLFLSQSYCEHHGEWWAVQLYSRLCSYHIYMSPFMLSIVCGGSFIQRSQECVERLSSRGNTLEHWFTSPCVWAWMFFNVCSRLHAHVHRLTQFQLKSWWKDKNPWTRWKKTWKSCLQKNHPDCSRKKCTVEKSGCWLHPKIVCMLVVYAGGDCGAESWWVLGGQGCPANT